MLILSNHCLGTIWICFNHIAVCPISIEVKNLFFMIYKNAWGKCNQCLEPWLYCSAKAVSAYFTSKQISPFGFAQQYKWLQILNYFFCENVCIYIPMLFQSWTIIYATGPTFKQHCRNVFVFAGMCMTTKHLCYLLKCILQIYQCTHVVVPQTASVSCSEAGTTELQALPWWTRSRPAVTQFSRFSWSAAIRMTKGRNTYEQPN